MLISEVHQTAGCALIGNVLHIDVLCLKKSHVVDTGSGPALLREYTLMGNFGVMDLQFRQQSELLLVSERVYLCTFHIQRKGLTLGRQ